MSPISFETLEEMAVSAAEGVRPPERLTVSQAAARYRRLNMPGSYVGPWKNETTPYLVEPMDVLTSRQHTGMVFAGPAQSGKTDMYLNWQAYTVICDPADMMLVEKSRSSARDFSIRRLDRLHRYTTPVGDRLIHGRNYDNTFDKHYASGMIVNLSWPTINELSGKPVPRLWLTDYDRMSQDVDGEGDPFDLARKRATTFQSHGMCAAESSPGFILEDPKWVARSPHEAPPTQGILKLYNRGDRRRWYWRCVNDRCRKAFEPNFSLFHWPKTDSALEAAEMASLRCPHCGLDYTHDPVAGSPGKHEMNRNGRWLCDGTTWKPSGEIVGTPHRSDIASFWLKGPAAAFGSWRDMVFKFLTAKMEYERTGEESALKATVNVDQGLPYTPQSQQEARLPETLKARAREIGRGVVPAGVRFLVKSIDVQKNRFEVQTHGIGVGGEMWVVDRYAIVKSRRVDPDGERYWVNPGAYGEDWKILVDEVMRKTYELSDGSGRHMAVKRVVCDSGGREGVTTNAYNFVRWLRDGKDHAPPGGETVLEQGTYEWVPGQFARFSLVKGDPSPKAPRVQVRYPDSGRKDRHAAARGEVPVLFINSNMVKDAVSNMLDRVAAGGPRINFPAWLADDFYSELTAEVRDPVKGWTNPRRQRNEAWDLLVYATAAMLTHDIGLEHIDWTAPPSWAAPWDSNDLVFHPERSAKPFETPKARPDLRSLAGKLT